MQLLQTGLADHAAVMGPMAEVVADSTQHLTTADLQAMVAYLQALSPPQDRRAGAAPAAT